MKDKKIKSGKPYNIKELNAEANGAEGYPEAVKIAEIIGKKITVLGAKQRESEKYGPFSVMLVRDGKKEFEVITSSEALIKVLDLGKFPFEAVIQSFKSKKRKNARYYAFKA